MAFLRATDCFDRGKHSPSTQYRALAEPSILLAISPAILSCIPPAISLVSTIMRHSGRRRALVVVALICVISAQLWATLVLWLATNYGFTGASC
jgi:hypothetical protein